MKQYKIKQFENGEKYIEAVPSGYPDWWREFEAIVNNSSSLETLSINLMYFEPFSIMPHHVNGQVVFNPLVYDFLENNQESLKDFRNGHIKGLKLFKKRYFKKYPKKKQAKTILKLYNSDFKETILRGDGFFNESNTAMLGFYNGILTGYWKYENDHLKDLLNTIDLKNEEPNSNTEKKKENPYPEIFKNNGFNIFEQINDNYKDLTNVTANYSFLYYAMKKDELIHCAGTEFIKFLASNYDLHIDRIDGRQYGQNKRTDYYNTIKAQ